MARLYPFLFLFLASCAPVSVIKLKGNYDTKPVYGYSNKPIEEVWDRIIDVVTDQGMAVKFIDKSSGLIISESYSFKWATTYEDQKGRPVDPSKYVVSERYDFSEASIRNVTASWNIVIRPADENRTAIKVGLVNIVSEGTIPDSPSLRAVTLHNFENWLLNMIR